MRSMAAAASLTVAMWPTRWRWATVLLGSLTVGLIGFAVISSDWHSASDVVGGWCISIAWVACARPRPSASPSDVSRGRFARADSEQSWALPLERHRFPSLRTAASHALPSEADVQCSFREIDAGRRRAQIRWRPCRRRSRTRICWCRRRGCHCECGWTTAETIRTSSSASTSRHPRAIWKVAKINAGVPPIASTDDELAQSNSRGGSRVSATCTRRRARRRIRSPTSSSLTSSSTQIVRRIRTAASALTLSRSCPQFAPSDAKCAPMRSS